MSAAVSHSHVINTFGGRSFDYDNPRPEDVSLQDIAYALHNICRFGGFVRERWSVLQHAMLVAAIVEDTSCDVPRMCLSALHHDSHEAYCGDLPTPLKRAIGAAYTDITRRVDGAIQQAFRMEWGFDYAPVIVADQQALFLEATWLKDDARDWREWGDSARSARWPENFDPNVGPREFMATHHRLASAIITS